MSEKLLSWIRFAIELEQKGLDFYIQCRRETKHPRAIELFDFLVKAETGHKRALEGLFDAVSKNDETLAKKGIEEFLKITTKIPLFEKEEGKKIIAPDTRLTQMFNKAIEFEKEGMSLYAELAKKEKDEDIKKLFVKLAADETLHKKEIIDLGYFVFGVGPPDEYM